MQRQTRSTGFTLVEILIGLTILSLLFVGGYSGYREFVRRQLLANSGNELKSNLNLIRQKALSGDTASACSVLDPENRLVGYQIVFTSSSYTASPKCLPYPASTSYSITYTLPLSVSLSTAGVSGFLLYNTVSGTNLTAQATLILTHTTGATKIVTISVDGVAE